MLTVGSHGVYDLKPVKPEYESLMFSDEQWGELRGGLYAWEVEEYARATGQTFEQAMQDHGSALFAIVPRPCRGAVIELLELVAQPLDWKA